MAGDRGDDLAGVQRTKRSEENETPVSSSSGLVHVPREGNPPAVPGHGNGPLSSFPPAPPACPNGVRDGRPQGRDAGPSTAARRAAPQPGPAQAGTRPTPSPRSRRTAHPRRRQRWRGYQSIWLISADALSFEQRLHSKIHCVAFGDASQVRDVPHRPAGAVDSRCNASPAAKCPGRHQRHPRWQGATHARR